MKITIRILATIVCLLLGFISNDAYGGSVNATSSKVASALPEKYDLEIDGLFYEIKSITDLTVKVVGGENVYSGEIVIPDVINHKGKQLKVTEIAEKCFYNSAVTYATIGNNILTIGEYAFGNTHIQEIKIPSSVQYLRKTTFNGCEKLKIVSFLDGEKTLNLNGNSYSSSFSGCPIEFLYIGRNIESTRAWSEIAVFSDLTNTQTIEIGKNVTKLYGGIFKDATKIEKLTIPSKVNYIGKLAFYHCCNLKSLIFEDGEDELSYYGESFPDKDNYFFSHNGKTALEFLYIGRNIVDAVSGDLFDYTPIDSLEIGEHVTNLMRLENLQKLTEIKIPQNVESIKSFWGCENIKTIICDCTTPPLGGSGFNNIVFVNATLYVPEGCVTAYQNADVWKNFFEIKEIDENAASPSIAVDENVGVVDIFDINGRKLYHPQKGFNILRYSDGTVKKTIL